jgi:hypothetical protein
MSGARDRFQVSPKEQAALTVAKARAQSIVQDRTARDVIHAAYNVRRTAAPGSFARAILDIADAEGLTPQLTRWWA